MPALVHVGRTVVTADAVVVATNVPVNDRVAIHTKQAPYMTYVIGARVPRGSVPRGALLGHAATPTTTSASQPSMATHDLLIVGGEDHKTRPGARHAERATAGSRRGRASASPCSGRSSSAGAGQVMEPIDSCAFIGRNPVDHDNVYVATGDSGMGMTHGTIAGMLLCDLILGRDEPLGRALRSVRA